MDRINDSLLKICTNHLMLDIMSGNLLTGISFKLNTFNKDLDVFLVYFKKLFNYKNNPINFCTLYGKDINNITGPLLYLLQQKFKTLLTARIPINYEDIIKNKSLDTAQLKSIFGEDAEGTDSTMENYMKTTGKLPNFSKFMANFSDDIEWIRALPQGSPVSGLMVNYLNELIINDINNILKEELYIDRFETVIYSDNIYVFYDNNPKVSATPYKIPSMISKIVNSCTEEFDLKMNKDKEMFFNDRDKKMLGLLINSEGDVRTSRRLRREINQIIINLNKYEEINYKGITYKRSDLQRLNGLITWLHRTANLGYNRSVLPLEF
jgi:hypothetical protein